MKKLIKKIGNIKFVKIFKSLSVNTRKLLSIGILFALVIALPLFVFAIVNQRFDLRKRAATSEPPLSVCVPINKVITVTPLSEYGGCHDLQEAINSVTGEGFIIKLTPGTYDIWKSVDVTNKQKLTIQGDRNTNSGAVHLVFKSTGYGFHITNSSGLIEWMDIGGRTANGMLSITNSTDFTVGYVQIYDTTAHTIDIGNSSNISIFNTEIQSSAGALEIYSTKGAKIMNNKIHNSANAISIYNSSDVDIKYNLIYANRETGIKLSNLQNTFIIFNTFIDNSQGGNYPTINLYGNQGSNYYFANNLVINGRGPGIKAESGQLFTGFTVNDFYGNSPNYSGYPDNTGIGGNISADPLLDTSLGYCLKSGSPALYGDPSRYEYMGHRGPCSIQTPPPLTPTPTPQCISEGGYRTVTLNAPQCCPGLSSISNWPLRTDGTCTPGPLKGTSICAKCGNGICGPRENKCNCPRDCPRISPTPTPPTVSCGHKCGGDIVGQGYSCQYGYVCYYPQPSPTGPGICRNPSCPEKTNCICSPPTPPPTATGTSKMKIRVKFAGVSNDSADGAKVTLRVYKESYHNYISSPFNVYYVGNGIYEGLIQFAPDTSVYPGSGNTFYIKGEKHLSRKFCYQTGQTELCRNIQGQITLYPANSLDVAIYDFTGLSLEPGDLLPQDGMVDSRDFQKIKTLLNKLSTDITQEDLYTGDLNYDGKINISDAFLLRKTLETKYDED